MTSQPWIVGLSLLGTLALLAGCGDPPAAQEASARPVKSMVVRAEASAGVGYAGVVEPRIETDLAFRTLGRIVSREVDVGSLVHKDQLIAEIDPLALQMALTSAQAELDNAQAQLENATINETRKRTLAATKSGSAADLDLAVQTLKTAEANRAEAQASLDKVREQLSYATLRAEFDGIVTATSAEVGQVVTAGQAVVKVARLDERDVVIDVPESQMNDLAIGRRYTIALQLDPSVETHGVLRELGPQADADTRSHRVKIALDTPPDAFRFGSVVTATPDGTTDVGIMLPERAVLRKDGATFVWVIDRRTATVILTAVDLRDSGSGTGPLRVFSGLSDGDEVATAGVHELADGQKIKLGQETRQ